MKINIDVDKAFSAKTYIKSTHFFLKCCNKTWTRRPGIERLEQPQHVIGSSTYTLECRKDNDGWLLTNSERYCGRECAGVFMFSNYEYFIALDLEDWPHIDC